MSVAAFSYSIARHGWRSVKKGGLPFFFAVLMTSLGLFSLGAFGTLLWNFERMGQSLGQSVAAVALLRVDGAGAAQEVRARIRLLPGVQPAPPLTPDEALARARRGLGDAGAALKGSEGLRMPWVVEVIPGLALGKDGTAARVELVSALRAVAGVDEVMHPVGEVQRVDALLALLQGAGIFLTVLVVLVVIVVVSNAVKLLVLVRRDEIEIQKLVGAADWYVRAPHVLAGLTQGVVGAVFAVCALLVAHETLARATRTALSGSIGTFLLEPLPASLLLLLVVGGGVLGVVGAALSVGRFLRV